METAIELAKKIGIDQFKINRETGSVIHHTSVVARDVVIGRNVYIGPLCIIGFPAEKKSMHNIGNVLINDDVIIHGSCTIDSGTDGVTIIGHKSYLMKRVHIGHDAIVNPCVTISPGVTIGGHCNIGTDCNIGMNACVHQFVHIPAGCMIGMGSRIVKGEYMPYRKYVDTGRDIGPNTYVLDRQKQLA
jgi:UDP-N-acetylglucosamine acyltransferase